MTSTSILRIRESLLWLTHYGAVYVEKSSDFCLNKLQWTININKPSDCDYSIILKNDCKSNSFQPFVVETLLEDRRSKERMHCSTLTVSSGSEILFKGNFEDTYKKLPGLKPYKEMTIVCTFYPSALLLTLNRQIPSFRIQRSLIFEIGKLTINQVCESPFFGLQKSTWKLIIRNISPSSVFEIVLMNCGGKRSFEPFEVATFMQEKRSHAQILCSKLFVTSHSEVLYRMSLISIYEKLPGLQQYGDMLIECVFCPFTESTLVVKTDTEMNVGSHENRNRAVLPQGYSMLYSSISPSLLSKKLSNFESLSKDFCNLADKNVLADIQLRCENEIVSAHKMVLAARSEVFLAMFQQRMVESGSGIVDIQDIELPVLRIFLKYLYSGQLPDNLTEDIACKLYAASDTYGVLSLRKLCTCYMSRKVSTENFVNYLILADKYNDKELKNATVNFIIQRPALMKNEKWVEFSENFPNWANEVCMKYIAKHISS